MDVRFFLAVFVLTIYCVPFSEGNDYGDLCDTNENCTGLTVCDTSDSNSTCVCDTTSYLDTTSSTCIAKHSLGQNCPVPTVNVPDTSTCTDANARCVSESNDYICKCLGTHYADSGSCIEKHSLGQNCPVPTVNVPDTSTCTDANARCVSESNDYICKCLGTHYADSGSCIEKHSLGQNCPVPTVNVPDTSTCTDANARCVSESNDYICKCLGTHYADSGSCIEKHSLGQNCPVPTVNVPDTSTCTDANARCVSESNDYICKCLGTHYADSGSCIEKHSLGQNCPVPTVNVPDTSTCTDANARCVSESNDYICKCLGTHYADSGSCIEKHSLGQNCPVPTVNVPDTSTCTDANARCVSESNDYICKCLGTHYADSGSCIEKHSLGQNCPVPTVNVPDTSTCTDANARCVSESNDYICKCLGTHYTDSGSCIEKHSLGQNCPVPTVNVPDTSTCTDANARCVSESNDYICKCLGTHYTDSGSCIEKHSLGQNCPVPTGNVPDTSTCTDANARCVSESNDYICKCLGTHYADSGSCIEKHSLGQNCPVPTGNVPDTSTCTDANARCVSESNDYICKCLGTHYADSGSCIEKHSLGQNCPVPTGNVPDTSTCTDANARCVSESNDYICKCLGTHYADSGSCIEKHSLGQNCPVPTGNVPDTSTCTDANARCVSDSNDYICNCLGTHYADSGSCIEKKDLDVNCPSNLGQTTSCKDSFARCTTINGGSKCRCGDSHYDNNGVDNFGGQCIEKHSLGQNCPVPTGNVPDTSTCTDANARCAIESNGYICKCLDTHYTDSGSCIEKKDLDVNCPSNLGPTTSCKDSFARCTTINGGSKCRCVVSHYNFGGQCIEKVPLDGSCPSGLSITPCADTNSYCIQTTGGGDYRCQCFSTYYDNNEDGDSRACVAKVDLGYKCPMPDACKTLNAVCQSSECVCSDNYFDNNGTALGGTCQRKIPNGDMCTNGIPGQCSDTNADCQQNNRCQCNSGYTLTGSPGQCNPNQPLGGSCNTGNAGSCSDANADCIFNICICNSAHYDDNGQAQQGNCEEVDDLQVTGLTISNPQTNGFTVKWTAPAKSLHVSSYTVGWRLTDNSNAESTQNVGNATEYIIVSTDIIPGRAYRVRVISSNNVTQTGSTRSTSVYKDQAASGSLQQDEEPNSPGQIDKQNSDFDAADKQIDIDWTAPSGFVSQYKVKMLEGEEEKTSLSVPQDYTSLSFSSMLNGQRYTISITALSETFTGGQPVESDPYTEQIKTVVKEPEPPRDVKCTEELENSITLTWLPTSLANGDLIKYHITVKQYSDGNVFSRQDAGPTATTAVVGGLQLGSYYTFEMVTENESYNSSQRAVTSSFCTTSAKESEQPSAFRILRTTGRSISFEWSDPVNTNSEEIMGYLIEVKDPQNDCKAREIYRCSDCVMNFESDNFQSTCIAQTPVISKTKAELTGKQHYNATGLVPDLLYTISVAAINLAGKGIETSASEKTNEEVPAIPVVTISGVGTTGFTVNWAIANPRPGNTTYTITVTADNPAESKQTQVNGFEKRSQEILGLEEFWNYSVIVKAETAVGGASSSAVSKQTLPAAPGVVAEFDIDRKPPAKNDQWKVSWKIPEILKRNSLITKYIIVHNGTGANSTQQEMEITAEADDYLYEQYIRVKAEQFYFVEVFAVNANGQNGTKMMEVMEALAGVPLVPAGPKDILPIQSAVATTETSIKITAKRSFFESSGDRGSVRVTGFIAYAASKADNFTTLTTALSDGYHSMDLDVYNRYPNWYQSIENGYTPFRPTKASWKTDMENPSSGRKKRDTSDIEYTIGIETCSSDTQDEYCNGPLQADTAFIVHVVVCTNGGCLVSSEYGPYRTQKVPEEDETPIAAIVGGVVGGLVVIAIVAVVLFIFMRRRRTPMRYVKEPEDIKIEPSSSETIPRHRPKRLCEFAVYTQNMHKDSNLLFSAEYEDLKAISPAHPQEESNREENRLKNRYINILPFDHSLVKLSSNGDEHDGSDFINANYLPGYRSQREYIGCQGPIPGTIDDFWRMIWEQNVFVIVMLTQCKEGQKVKCEQYWPDDVKEPKQYGEIIVEVTSKSTINSYDFRIFNLTVGNKSMSVKHFHFLSWMDFSANVQTNTLIEFIKQVRAHVQPPDRTGPTIVHCSAGVGRTGTYITLDHLMQFIDDHDDEETIDIFSQVLALRDNRPHMVQTEQQYIFIHDCVAAYLEMKQQAIYQNLGYEEEENMYQNGPSLYENVQFKPEQRTNL